VHEHQTLVIYMGLVSLAQICERLIENGMAADMPIALVEKGTQPDQRVITGTLRNIATLAEQAEVKPPALIIVGKVVTLREKLDWFSKVQS